MNESYIILWYSIEKNIRKMAHELYWSTWSIHMNDLKEINATSAKKKILAQNSHFLCLFRSDMRVYARTLHHQ